jgi:trehalose 6-phosphate phosphatase
LPYPPADLLAGASLLLDLDGTLLELIDRPDEVVADRALRDLLARLDTRLGGRLAVVSGRSLEQVDAILGDIAADLAVSGSHGCEHRRRGVRIRPDRPAALDEAATRLRAFADTHEGVLLEVKSFGVALHYRLNPAAGNAARAIVMPLADQLGLAVQHGKMMVELRLAGGDKGRAVHHLMDTAPMAGTRPVFIGDDDTDEPAFVAARELGGHGVLIGPARPSAADYGLPGPAALRGWLAEAVR